MLIQRIEALDIKILEQILQLINRLKNKSFTLEQYARYIRDYFPSLGLFGAFDNNRLIAYIHVELPHPLNKKTGYIFCAVTEGTSKEVNDEILKKMEIWLLDNGADSWQTDTSRNPLAWTRRYGLTFTGEYQMGRKINV